MQPSPYEILTNFADDERLNAGGRSTVRTDRLDQELENIQTPLNQTIANLALIQRDDGKLLDGLVEPYNFSSASMAYLSTRWLPRGLWATATAYAVSDLVDVSGTAYVCAIAHTSGVFATDYASGKWQIFAIASSASAVLFSSTATISAANVQSAIEEVDTESRSANLPVLTAFYGGL